MLQCATYSLNTLFCVFKSLTFFFPVSSSCPTPLAPPVQRHLLAVLTLHLPPRSNLPQLQGVRLQSVKTLVLSASSTLACSGSHTVIFNCSLSRRVKNISPWVSRDVEAYTECEIDAMIEELLYRCRDKTKPDPDKSALFRKALNAVLTVCNDGKSAQDIKEFLNHL